MQTSYKFTRDVKDSLDSNPSYGIRPALSQIRELVFKEPKNRGNRVKSWSEDVGILNMALQILGSNSELCSWSQSYDKPATVFGMEPRRKLTMIMRTQKHIYSAIYLTPNVVEKRSPSQKIANKPKQRPFDIDPLLTSPTTILIDDLPQTLKLSPRIIVRSLLHWVAPLLAT